MGETSNYRSELVSRLRSASDDLAWAVRGLGVMQLAYKPSLDDWSIHENLAHLRDMEQRVYLPLLRWATVPDMLDPDDYNRVEWQRERYDRDEPLRAIMDDINRMRDEEFEIFRQMSDVTWTRVRTDSRWGPLTCQWIAELMYRHVLDHLQAIMGLRQDLNLAALHASSETRGGVIGGDADS